MIYYIIIWNFIVCLIYGIDKLKAIKGGWRISEKTLILLAFLMGGLGAYMGMNVFHHKTKKVKFRILVPVTIVLNIVFYLLWVKIKTS